MWEGSIMKQKGFDNILLAAIAVILVGSLLTIGLTVILTNSNKPTPVITTQNSPPSQAQSGAIATASPDIALSSKAATLTPDLTPTTITATPTQAVSEQGVTIVNPTVKAGEKISVPLENHVAIKVLRTLDLPLISLQQARTAVYNNGMSWALGGTQNGKTVTLTAVYGLVTLGAPNTNGNGKGWLGPQNIDLPTCSTDGKCTSTGIILNHIENRPMWVLDYGNTDFPAPGPACLTTPCPTPQIFNHSVYTVDGQTGAIFTIDFYTAS